MAPERRDGWGVGRLVVGVVGILGGWRRSVRSDRARWWDVGLVGGGWLGRWIGAMAETGERKIGPDLGGHRPTSAGSLRADNAIGGACVRLCAPPVGRPILRRLPALFLPTYFSRNARMARASVNPSRYIFSSPTRSFFNVLRLKRFVGARMRTRPDFSHMRASVDSEL